MKTGSRRAKALALPIHTPAESLSPYLTILLSAALMFAVLIMMPGEARAELKPLNNFEMSAIAGQGVENDQQEIEARNAGLNGLAKVAQSTFPVLGFIQSDTSVRGVRYAEGVQPLEINLADGSITINLPEYIENVSLSNLRPKGASANGPSFGSIELRGLRFHNSSITIKTKP
ncbi:hypothetical protein [Parendozoicomonas haliclonae]|uniref:Uncharacterized protein n=1 Tax=Parendozoicomonas haliclonae TaxID=1960125 RepID=A0A1X7AQ18_9GAMM|nr:hypothetical protein [Parendozoicomonas haliclonae]SMA49491.1 hypothetical protein EHSB41UT_03289 [Parendozoicomonas haliclonae]